MSDLIQRLYAEADLYRNEGACDIADFLDEASRRIAELEAANRALQKRANNVNIAFARRSNARVMEANDRAKRAEAALERAQGAVRLPRITEQILDDLGPATLLIEATDETESGWSWTQDAVDFACLLNQHRLSMDKESGDE